MKVDRMEGDNYAFRLTDCEVCRRLWECLSTTNPELPRDCVRRAEHGRAYVAEFARSDGETVRIHVDVRNLKRYFGAFILAFEDGGIRFRRRMKYRRRTRA